MANDLYAHTMTIHNGVSVRNVQYICQKYNIPFKNEFRITEVKIAGIKNLTFKREKYPGGDRFDMKIQINIGRLIKKSNYSMTVINNKTVNRIIQSLNDIFTYDFKLNRKKCNSGEWHICRFDCGIDLRLCTDNPLVLREYIKLLHESFDENNARKVLRSNYKCNKPWEKIRYESITLSSSGEDTGSQIYKYNIYFKLQQLENDGVKITDSLVKEIGNVIRIEKQIYKLSKVTKASNKLKSLLDEDITEKIMNGIVGDMRCFFGTDDYQLEEDAYEKIYRSSFNDQYKDYLYLTFLNIMINGYRGYRKALEKVYSTADEWELSNRIIKLESDKGMLESIGISSVATNVDEAFRNINTLIADQLFATRKPRKKGTFAKIIEVKEPSGNTRFKCNPSLYKYDGTTTRLSLASRVGGTREDCELIVLNAIESLLNDNLNQPGSNQAKCYEYALDEAERFITYVESANIKSLVFDFIKKVTNQLAVLNPNK